LLADNRDYLACDPTGNCSGGKEVGFCCSLKANKVIFNIPVLLILWKIFLIILKPVVWLMGCCLWNLRMLASLTTVSPLILAALTVPTSITRRWRVSLTPSWRADSSVDLSYNSSAPRSGEIGAHSLRWLPAPASTGFFMQKLVNLAPR